MLKTISPLLNADLLHALASMGHGDFLALVDANFPADALARHTVVGRPLAIANVTAAEATAAILSLMPLDSFIGDAARRMEIDGQPDTLPPVQEEVQVAIDQAEGKHWPLRPIGRFAYYDKAKEAYAIVRTGERRFFGCFILTKGVIAPDAG